MIIFFQKRIFGNVKFEEHHRTVTLFDTIGNKFIEGHIGESNFWFKISQEDGAHTKVSLSFVQLYQMNVIS